MKHRNQLFAVFAMSIWMLASLVYEAAAQSEVMAWGNMIGIRIDGHVMEFETFLRVVPSDWSGWVQTGRERQRPQYSRDGSKQTITTTIAPFTFTEIVEDIESGVVTVDVSLNAQSDSSLAGAYFSIDFPGAEPPGGAIELIPTTRGAAELTRTPNGYQRAVAGGVRIVTPRKQLEVTFEEPAEVLIPDDGNDSDNIARVFITLVSGDVAEGQTAQNKFTLTASGEIDRDPIELVVDAASPGRLFDGFGGNFRLQNPDTDPPVIQYNLDNMRIAWGRVEMPWRFWHPDENVDPIEAAEAGNLHPAVHGAMQMAQRLAKKGIPVIVSDWSGPQWALSGDPRSAFRPQPGGLRGNPLNPEKMEKICESIGKYLLYLKHHYGVEAAMFSFNESDLGIYVRQTGEEHAYLIKTLGAHLASIGLATKMLLGDTSDARPVDFIRPAMEDPETFPYIGAISFHSWRGCTDEILKQWGEAATELNVPLLVGEGSTDAAAWTYPDIFSESTFAFYEINLYTRICAVSQPRSILQWQLTADYSLLVGGGVFGNTEEPLHPTQRFWNLKQLASTPERAFYLPIQVNRPGVNCVAFGDIANGRYAVHVVNNGAARQTTLSGLPDHVKELRVFVTDSRRGMEEGRHIPVYDGVAQFTLDAASFTTLMSD